MEDVELIALGAMLAVGLSLSELLFGVLGRIIVGMGVTALTAVTLWALHLSIGANAVDFMQFCVGAYLSVRMMDTWIDQHEAGWGMTRPGNARVIRINGAWRWRRRRSRS